MNKLLVPAPKNSELMPAPSRLNPMRRISILLADDDFYTRELNAGVLLRSGYRVETAEDGVAAWQALNDDRYDLLITEHLMPWVTGLELIQKLRSEARTLPVILASGMPPVEELNRHPGLQIQATLQKTCTPEVLLTTVRQVLGATGATDDSQ